ncbi:leucine-rich repeat-containing protein 74A [Acipenser oxyrinchus oxyrinchus]|uniref:Leucine-rich repeat-containing protein 74A n=1 Tax=Acipenser oxyrinchus oxyrinchus TaxID=40147 RepID=A0AAD8GBM1_ACIOX|nr:leucine-rich repeat-containing protein 74A [Acipenser oxyrinchus oxyrinchus]
MDEPENEWDTDLEDAENRKSKHDLVKSEQYILDCARRGAVPCSLFIKNLDGEHLNLNHYGLGVKGVQALACLLKTHTKLLKLELEDNNITIEGVKYISDMLIENCFIQHLNLAHNQLQTAGAKAICDMLRENNTLETVNFSGNYFKDKDAKFFADAFAVNSTVRVLDLSHNEFSLEGGEHLGRLLVKNQTLEVLNLCWNHLRLKGAVAVCGGLQVNNSVRKLDLSWNGFGDEGAFALTEVLKCNKQLEFLDLTNNRISCRGAKMLATGLAMNSTLQFLKLSRNPLTLDGTMALLLAVKDNQSSTLEELDVSNVLVNEAFLQLLEETRKYHPKLLLHYAGMGGWVSKKPKEKTDPMKAIQDYLVERKLRLWDFFRNIDKAGTQTVSIQEFRGALQNLHIPLQKNALEELIQRLDVDRNGNIDYSELLQGQKDFLRKSRHVENQRQKVSSSEEKMLSELSLRVKNMIPADLRHDSLHSSKR